MIINFLQILLFAHLIAAFPAKKAGDTEVTHSEDEDDDEGDSIPSGISTHEDPLPEGFGQAMTIDLSNIGQLLGKLPDAKAFQHEQNLKKKKQKGRKKGDFESVSGDFWGENVNMGTDKDTTESGTSPATDKSEAADTSKTTKTTESSEDASASKTTKKKDKTTKALSKRAPNPERLARVRTCLKDARKAGAPFQYYTSRSSSFEQYSNPYNQRLENVVAEVIVVVLPGSGSAGVSAAVRCAAASRMPVQPRAGGHSYAAYSSAPDADGGGMVIDLRNLDTIGYDRSQGLFIAGVGSG